MKQLKKERKLKPYLPELDPDDILKLDTPKSVSKIDFKYQYDEVKDYNG